MKTALLSKQKNCNKKPDILSCSAAGDIEAVKSLLTSGVEVNVKSKNGWNPLIHATYYNHTNIAEILLSNTNIDVDHKDSKGRSAVSYAALFGYVYLIDVLADYGADLNIADYKNQTPFQISQNKGHEDSSLKLACRGASLDKDKTSFPLHFIAQCGKPIDVERLVENGADVNIREASGFTPAYTAAEYGRVDILDTLVSLGGDINLRNREGGQAIHIAAREGQNEVIVKLVGYGADVNSLTNTNYTPLIIAASYNKPNTILILLTLGAIADIKNHLGFDALHHAKSHQNQEAISLLTKYATPEDSMSFPEPHAVFESSIFNRVDSKEPICVKGDKDNELCFIAGKYVEEETDF